MPISQCKQSGRKWDERPLLESLLTSDFPVPVDPRMTINGVDGGLQVDIVEEHRIVDRELRRGVKRVLIMGPFSANVGADQENPRSTLNLKVVFYYSSR